MDINKVVAGYIKLRDKIDELKKDHKAQLKELTDKQDKLAAFLEKRLTEIGVDNVKVDAGTVFRATKDSVTVANKAEFGQFILDQIEDHGLDALYMMTMAASKTAVKDYMADNEDEPPPGISYTTKQEIQIRRAS
jgi:chromosome condensin MukBEF complex kleisin-like MukF subunit